MSVSVVARVLRGLEWVAADEIAGIPAAAGLRMSPRQVLFRTPALGPEILGLRTVDDAFLVVGATRDPGHTKDVPPKLARWVAGLDWKAGLRQIGELRPIPARPRFDVVASFAGRRNFNRYAVEDALGAELGRLLGGDYQSRTPRAGKTPELGPVDVTVRLFLDGGQAVATLRIAARPLHRRDYKLDTGPGTLHPALAAMLARVAAPEPGSTVLDPFCGDGTIAIEAAIACPPARVTAADLDPERVENTRRNAARAGVDITVRRADAGAVAAEPGSVSVLLTNPPWNLAVDAAGSLKESLKPFWRRIPEVLTPSARICVVSDNESETAESLRRGKFEVGLTVQLRIAGRLAQLVLAAPPGAEVPQLPEGLRRWRQQALDAGLVGEDEF